MWAKGPNEVSMNLTCMEGKSDTAMAAWRCQIYPWARTLKVYHGTGQEKKWEMDAPHLSSGSREPSEPQLIPRCLREASLEDVVFAYSRFSQVQKAIEILRGARKREVVILGHPTMHVSLEFGWLVVTSWFFTLFLQHTYVLCSILKRDLHVQLLVPGVVLVGGGYG